MIAEPKCWTRRCRHLIGVVGRDEERQRVVCEAFPDGIPDTILRGEDLHDTPLPKQGNAIVYEKETEE